MFNSKLKGLCIIDGFWWLLMLDDHGWLMEDELWIVEYGGKNKICTEVYNQGIEAKDCSRMASSNEL